MSYARHDSASDVHAGVTNVTFAPDRAMKVHPAWLQREQVRVGDRDFCSHLLIPLNRCRRKNYFMPGACKEERAAFSQCQWTERVREQRRQQTKAGQ